MGSSEVFFVRSMQAAQSNALWYVSATNK